MKVILIGYGKMGKEIESVLKERRHTVSLIIDADNRHELTAENMRAADVAIEFTTPHTAYENVLSCLNGGLPIVCGTTGWNDKMEVAKKLCLELNGTFFYASNFSIGVNIFFAVNTYLAKLMNRFPEYGISMTEVHHTQKKDAPSGTAVTLAEGIMDNIERKTAWVNNETDDEATVGILSVREGSVAGIHNVVYDSPSDIIEIRHESKNRRALALGAVLAAEYTQGRKGILTMSDLLDIK